MTLQDGNETILKWNESEYQGQSHVKRLVGEACRIAQSLNETCLLLLDRYFLTKPAIEAIKEAAEKSGGIWPVILITRPKDNYTAWFIPDTQASPEPEGGADSSGTAENASKPKRGRKRKEVLEGCAPKKEKPPLGEKLKIMDIFKLKAKDFVNATLTLYGECEDVSYYCVNLLWGRDLYQELRFVFVKFNDIESVFVSTALNMDPRRIVEIYCYRFKIETFFRAFKQSIAGFGYHFWTHRLPALNIFIKAEAMEQKIKDVTAQISIDSITSTYHAIEGFVMFACIATGIIQLCSLRFADIINSNQNRWTRTSNNNVPAEETTLINLRFSLPLLFNKCGDLALVRAIKARQAIDDIEHDCDSDASKSA
jgi:hypothetical protein